MTHILKLFPYSEYVGGVIVPFSQDNTLFAIKNVDALHTVCTKNMNQDFLVELELLLLLSLF